MSSGPEQQVEQEGTRLVEYVTAPAPNPHEYFDTLEGKELAVRMNRARWRRRGHLLKAAVAGSPLALVALGRVEPNLAGWTFVAAVASIMGLELWRAAGAHRILKKSGVLALTAGEDAS